MSLRQTIASFDHRLVPVDVYSVQSWCYLLRSELNAYVNIRAVYLLQRPLGVCALELHPWSRPVRWMSFQVRHSQDLQGLTIALHTVVYSRFRFSAL